MKKYFYFFALIIVTFLLQAHTSHYKGIIKIEMEVFRNDKKIGYSNYFFEHHDDLMIVKNYTQFEVKLFGAKVFSISSEAIEKYKDDSLISFTSTTLQNDKKKYVDLIYDESKDKFLIKGSSYTGEANINCVIGNWWNHEILKATKQISPLSGSIKSQTVKFVGNENITLYGKNYFVSHYKLKSDNKSLPDDKKLDFDIWLDKKNNLILKVKYKKMGEWEYRLKEYKIN